MNKELEKDKYGYFFEKCGIRITIDTEEYPTKEVIDYAENLVNFYIENKDKVNDFIYSEFKKMDWYTYSMSKDDILTNIGKPIIYVDNVNVGSLVYLNNKIDEHLITLYFYGLKFDSVSIDG